MTVKELCAEHKVAFQTIYKKITRHKDELAGHIKKEKGKPCELDETAVRILLPQSVINFELEERLEDANSEIQKLRNEIGDKENIIGLKQMEINSLNSKIEGLNREIERSGELFVNMKNTSENHFNEAEELRKEVRSLNGKISEKDSEIEGLKGQLDEKDAKIHSLEKRIKELENSMSECSLEITELNLAIMAKDKEITELKAPKNVWGKKKEVR